MSVMEDNELRRAERVTNGPEHPCGGCCRDCASFREDCLRGFNPGNALEGFGICMDCPDDPQIVGEADWHGWDECWHGEVSSVELGRELVGDIMSDLLRLMAVSGTTHVSAFCLKGDDGERTTHLTMYDGDRKVMDAWRDAK